MRDWNSGTEQISAQIESCMKNYKTLIITFADLLRFREMVNSNIQAEQVLKTLDLLREHANADAELSRILDLKTIQMSDCVIRGLSVKKNAGTALLQWELPTARAHPE